MLSALLPPLTPTGTTTRRPPATVYVMRHCDRSTYLPDLEWSPRYAYLANYSDGGELPSWGVAPTLCTARGREIIRGQGRNLRAEFSRYAGALKVVFDSGSQRDATTAAEFLAGLGLPNISTGDFGLFNPAEAGYCPELTAAERAAAVQERLAAVPPLSGLRGRLASLQRALGAGVAPPLQEISDSVSAEHGAWVGGTYVAGAWIEAMLLQYGAGLPIAYGRITPAQLYELLELHVYYRAVNDRPFAVEQRGGSNLLAHALADLRGGGGGASLYVGHDTNLDQFGVLCDLAWDDIAPYPANATPPGSMLRLTASDACANFPLGGGLCERVVSADFLYTTFETTDGAMRVAPATFAGGARTMPLRRFEEKAAAAIDARCVRMRAVAPPVEAS